MKKYHVSINEQFAFETYASSARVALNRTLDNKLTGKESSFFARVQQVDNKEYVQVDVITLELAGPDAVPEAQIHSREPRAHDQYHRLADGKVYSRIGSYATEIVQKDWYADLVLKRRDATPGTKGARVFSRSSRGKVLHEVSWT